MNRTELENLLADELGDEFVTSYFDRSPFTEGASPILYPWSMVAAERFRDRARHLLEREGVRLGPPVCDHLKPKPRKAR